MEEREKLRAAANRWQQLTTRARFRALSDVRKRYMRLNRKPLRRQLRFWLRFVKHMCSLAIELKRRSMDATEKTVVSEFYYLKTNGPSDVTDAAFDKNKFRRKFDDRLPIFLQKITHKPPAMRTDVELNGLLKVMNRIRSFQYKFTDAMQHQICRTVQYTFCEKGRVIVRQDHVGYNFYFIYTGSCLVQKNKLDPETMQPTTVTEHVLRKGDSFGELALLGDGLRTASIICGEATEIFQIEKDTFMEFCPDIFQKEMDFKIQFARSFSLFESVDFEPLRNLCFQSQITEIPDGKLISHDWSHDPNIYFILKGRILLLRKLDLRRVHEQYNVTVRVNMNKKIPWPREVIGSNYCRYAAVGLLQAGQYTDLRILNENLASQIPSLIMVSEGVSVLRMSVFLIRSLVPRQIIDNFLRKSFKPFSIPGDKELSQRVLENLNWQHFKSKLTETLRLERSGGAVASVAATAKGTSGWSRWPGRSRLPKSAPPRTRCPTFPHLA
ncbi:uncharacterized protein LOC141913363 [Tubulanus polymorphus]|uniref:uncharacterized protein LOC141913363 n=1 Tax=Tubulanus polymorphus TaxID=672921 RepID=UPI003DA2B13C